MTVRCKHGTEVYKFRCPECADEERGRNMTADKFDSADGQTHCDMDAERRARETDTRADSLRIWVVQCPFKKNGFPSVGSYGSTVRPVVIIPTATWNRLVSTIPELAKTQFEVGEES